MKHLKATVALGCLLGLAACKKDGPIVLDNPTIIDDEPIGISNLVVDPNFNFETTREIDVEFTVLDHQDNPLAYKRIDIYTAPITEGGRRIVSGITNQSGVYASKVQIPTYLNGLHVEARVIGIGNQLTIDKGGLLEVSHVFGGTGEKVNNVGKPNGRFNVPMKNNNYNYMGTYDANGVPNYLTTPDVIDQGMLNDIYASLPENQPVPIHNPQYLSNNATTIELSADADVWVTFVHEGAGYQNALAYYTYDVNNPPTSAADITPVTIVLPNASFNGAGGGMNAGDKVHLGNFPAGTGIGWALVANGWNGTDVGAGQATYYSHSDWNPESTAANRQHNVILIDPVRQKLLVGFEDLNRDGNSDEDFNDLVFYADISPLSAVSNQGGYSNTSQGNDDDGDGVNDEEDDENGEGVVQNFYPGEEMFGTLAYEDLWPSEGDYDCNDLVINYQIVHTLDANNDVVSIDLTYTIEAIGAGFTNAFGFELGVDGSHIQSVTGSDLRLGYLNIDANGCEAGQSKAVIFAFDDPKALMGVTGMVNVHNGQAMVTPYTMNMSIELTNPVPESQLTLPPYNPFIVKNQDRSKEIHLPGYTPTDLVNTNVFGSADDASLVNGYYKTANGLPWALHFPDNFDHPVEGARITDAYMHFATWAQSNGTQYPDWYLNIPGYRDMSKIYDQ